MLLLLELAVFKVDCEGQTSPQPRGPDLDKTTVPPTTDLLQEDGEDEAGEEGIGECPADQEQVSECGSSLLTSVKDCYTP